MKAWLRRARSARSAGSRARTVTTLTCGGGGSSSSSTSYSSTPCLKYSYSSSSCSSWALLGSPWLCLAVHSSRRLRGAACVSSDRDGCPAPQLADSPHWRLHSAHPKFLPLLRDRVIISEAALAHDDHRGVLKCSYHPVVMSTGGRLAAFSFPYQSQSPQPTEPISATASHEPHHSSVANPPLACCWEADGRYFMYNAPWSTIQTTPLAPRSKFDGHLEQGWIGIGLVLQRYTFVLLIDTARPVPHEIAVVWQGACHMKYDPAYSPRLIPPCDPDCSRHECCKCYLDIGGDMCKRRVPKQIPELETCLRFG